MRFPKPNVDIFLLENLPRRQEAATEDEEHRMGWMLVGMAVRIGYMLGLDQKTLRPLTPGVEDDDKAEEDGTLSENERLDRDRLAWTCECFMTVQLAVLTKLSSDCYIFDRRYASVFIGTPAKYSLFCQYLNPFWQSVLE